MTIRAPEVSVVLPVYNEAENLEPLLQELATVLDGLDRPSEVVAVDDGSTDDSFRRLVALAAQEPRLRVVRLARNYGQTAALAAGLEHARAPIIVSMDADGQNDPADIPRLLAALTDDVDVVNGWRAQRRDAWLTRRLPSQVANRLVSLVTGTTLHDYGCTLRAMRADVARELRLYGEMHRFIPALAADLGARVLEVPVHHRPRLLGRSKYGLSRTLRVLLDLLTVKFLSGFSTRPIHLFGLFGLLCATVGLVLTAELGFERLALGVRLGGRPVVLLAILLVVVGFQFVSLGLLGEMLVRTYHESQAKPIYRVREVVDGAPAPARRGVAIAPGGIVDSSGS
ncbi:MAG TPA: glycosyltransferase family 2 protein [Candidatus Binatia bacterium]|nr:glycosyltransferase family 2 protein [Candidatus Binatia bacterium]